MSLNKKNSSWLATQYIVTLFVSLINLKINLLHFGSELFGLWIMVAALWGFGSALDLGFGTAVVKYVAEYNQHDKKRLNSFLSSSLIAFISLGIIIFIIGIVVGDLIYFKNNSLIDPIYLRELKLVFFVLGLAFYFQYLTIFVKSIFEGFSNFIWPSKITLIQNACLLLGVILIFIFKLELIYLAFLYFIIAVFILFIYLIFIRKLYPNYQINIKYFRYSEVKSVISYSFSVQTITIFSALIDPVVKYILGNFYKVEFISVYEIARRFAIAISSLFFVTFRTLLPKASILKSKNEIKDFILGEVANITKIGIAYSSLFFGVGSLFISLFIQYWFGYNTAILIFLILALPESINSFGYSNYITLLGLGHALFLARLQFINLFLVSITLIFAFTFYSNVLGLLGYFISVILVNIYMLVYINRKFGINVKEFLIIVNFKKLILHILFLFSSMILIYSKLFNFYLILASLSIISIIIFKKEYITYSKLFLDIINRRLIKT